jgi:hypothetical protein
MHCQYVLSHLPNAYTIFKTLQLYFVLDILSMWWTKLRIKELNDLYCSLEIVWVIKSRRIVWAGLVARMG